MHAILQASEPSATDALPDAKPPRQTSSGGLWLIGLAPSGPVPPREIATIAAADIVIYDEALAPLLGPVVPPVYAEPAADGDAADLRCVRLALDGWRVVRLADSRRPSSRRNRLNRLVALLSPALPAAADEPWETGPEGNPAPGMFCWGSGTGSSPASAGVPNGLAG